MHVLPKTTKINRFATDVGAVRIKLSRFDCVVCKCERVKHTRFPRTVGTIEQCYWSYRYTLAMAECLEVREVEGLEGHGLNMFGIIAVGGYL